MKAAIGAIVLVLVAVTHGQVLQFRRGRNPQCDIVPPFRNKCGNDGISKDDCTALDCCYGFASLPKIPRCYQKKAGITNPGVIDPPQPGPPKMQCDVIPPLRTRCAEESISQDDCLKKGCCYEHGGTLPGIPRCYNQS